MKNLRALIVACLVVCSVVLAANSAMAATVSVWEISDTANNDIYSDVEFNLPALLEGNLSSIFTGSQEFGMYEAGNINNSMTLLKQGKISVTAIYNPSTQTFSLANRNSINLASSSGKFSFYFKDSDGFYTNASFYNIYGSSYEFKVTNMAQIVNVHDIKPSAVPIPSAVILFGTGLAGLVGLKRRKTQA